LAERWVGPQDQRPGRSRFRGRDQDVGDEPVGALRTGGGACALPGVGDITSAEAGADTIASSALRPQPSV